MVKIRSKDSGVVYEVTLDSCTCPHYLYRLKRTGGVCKHMQFLMQHLAKQQEKKVQDIEITDGMDAVEFVEKYSEEQLDILKQKGDVIEKRGRLYKLS